MGPTKCWLVFARITYFLIFCASLSQCAPIERRVDYTGHRLVTVWPRTSAQLQFLAEIQDDERYEIDFWSEPITNRSIDLHIPPTTYPEVTRLFRQEGIYFRVKIRDIQSLIEPKDASPGSRSASDSARRSRSVEDVADHPRRSIYYDFSVVGEYARVHEINMWLEAATVEFPNIAEVVEIGQSYEDRPLKVLKISSGGHVNKSAIWIDAGIHAREWISPATVVYIINQLLTGYDVDETVTSMVDTFDWYILPVVNPDGYEYSHTIDRLWRKTRRPIPGFFRCKGVDANRNYDYSWRDRCISAYYYCRTADPCSRTYAGDAPFSEPETRAMANFLLQHQRQLKVYLSFHAYAQMWLTNWGDSTVQPTDYRQLIRVARKGAGALRRKYGTTYIVGSPARILYAAGGTSFDWAKAVAGIKYSYTLELRDLGQFGFLLPSSQILPTGQETWDAIKAVAAEVAKEATEPEVEPTRG